MSAKKSDGLTPVGTAQSTTATNAAPKYTGSNMSKSSYPTDEERAKTQVYIVRQSNITAAINLLSVGSKTPPKLEDVISTAKVFENHVFGTSNDPLDDTKPAVAAGHEFDDLDDMPQ